MSSRPIIPQPEPMEIRRDGAIPSVLFVDISNPASLQIPYGFLTEPLALPMESLPLVHLVA